MRRKHVFAAQLRVGDHHKHLRVTELAMIGSMTWMGKPPHLGCPLKRPSERNSARQRSAPPLERDGAQGSTVNVLKRPCGTRLRTNGTPRQGDLEQRDERSARMHPRE